MSALRDLLKLPTEKEIKTAVLDLIDQGAVIAIEGDDNGIKYFDTDKANPALLSRALSSEEVKAIRIRNQSRKAAGTSQRET